MQPDQRLEQLLELEDRYSGLIKNSIERAEEDNLLPVDIHKHVQSLEKLTKIRMRLEQQAPARRPPEIMSDEEFDGDAKFVMEHYIGNDGDKMVRAANRLLQGLKERCIQARLDPKTGKWVPVEWSQAERDVVPKRNHGRATEED